ncbi:MAG: hypothetical protein WB491_03220 [Candidatus Aquilonibacter sp.]
MKSRKEFLATAGAAALLGATASPTPSPTPTPPPSSAAHEFALRMRKFDPSLTDAQIDAIAAGIDQGFAAGKTIRAHHALRSGDGPAPEFSVDA